MHSKNQPLKKTLPEMASDEQFIHGICNYCNRWCERCSKTQQCLSFAHDQLSKGIDLKQSNNDLENKKFWNAIERILKTNSNNLFQNASAKLTEKITSTNIVSFAKHYGDSVNNWLIENNTLLAGKSKLIVAKYDDYKTIRLFEAVEIVKWYSIFISERIVRSLNEMEERKKGDFNDSKNPFRDNIGSAKNTIVACKHSLAAFSLLYFELEKYQPQIELFITQLIQIKNQLMEIFPEVIGFKRPGFDA